MNKIIRLDSFSDLAKLEIENNGYYKSLQENTIQIGENKKYFEDSKFIQKVKYYINKKQTYSPIIPNSENYQINDGSEYFVYPDNLDYFNTKKIGERKYLPSSIFNFWASNSFNKIKGKNIKLFSYTGPFVTKMTVDIGADGVPIQKEDGEEIGENPILSIYEKLAENIDKKIFPEKKYKKQVFNYLVSINALSHDELILPIVDKELKNTYHKIDKCDYINMLDILDQIAKFINKNEQIEINEKTCHYFAGINDDIISKLNKYDKIKPNIFFNCSRDDFVNSYNNVEKGIPLFYMYPPKIEFKFEDGSGDKAKLLVCDRSEKYKVEYGKDSKTFRADKKLTSTEKSFTLPVLKDDVSYKRDGKEVHYECEISNYENNEKVKVGVEFKINLGKDEPKIILSDVENKDRKIAGEFKIVESDKNTKSVINPPFTSKTLVELRKEKIDKKVERVRRKQYEIEDEIKSLFEIIKNIEKEYNQELIEELGYELENNDNATPERWLLELCKGDELSIANFDKIKINTFFNDCKNFLEKERKKSSFVGKMFIRTGVLYGFSKYIFDFDDLDEDTLLEDINGILELHHSLSDELFKYLSRLTFHPKVYHFFTGKLYDKIMTGDDNKLKEHYIWGYSRTLFWYCNYNNTAIDFDPKTQFKNVLNLELGDAHKQSSMMSLLFLLTFIESNENFKSYIFDDKDDIKKKIEKNYENVMYKELEIPYTNKNGDKDSTEYLNKAFIEILDGSKVELENLLKEYS